MIEKFLACLKKSRSAKGQLNSELIYEDFWGFLGEVVSNMISNEAQRNPESPKEAIKTCRAEILTIFSLLFWKIDVLVNSF